MPGLHRVFLSLLLLPWLATGAEVCDVVYFHEADCPDCGAIERLVLPKLAERYGERLRIHRRDVAEERHFEAMMGFELKYGLKPQEVPEFYTAHGASWEPKKIAEELPTLIDRALADNEPGPFAGFLASYLGTGETGIPVAKVLAEQYGGKKAPAPLLVHEFRKPGCKSCGRVTQSLRYLAGKHPGRIKVVAHSTKERGAQVLLQALCTKHGVPEKLHLVAPAVFYGDKAIVGEAAFKDRDLVGEIVGVLQAGAHPATYEPTPEDLARAEDAIQARFSRIAWPAVLLAGLLDGVNPCAFVTIIFLLSYLSLRQYRRRDAMLVGAAFTAAVFATYLLVGVGFLQFTAYLQELPYFRPVVYWLAAVLAAVVGVLNLRDAWRIHRGALADMGLKLGDQQNWGRTHLTTVIPARYME